MTAILSKTAQFHLFQSIRNFSFCHSFETSTIFSYFLFTIYENFCCYKNSLNKNFCLRNDLFYTICEARSTAEFDRKFVKQFLKIYSFNRFIVSPKYIFGWLD